jgi:WD40 repeat protein
MPRSENGGVIGATNLTSTGSATGVFTLKQQFVVNGVNLWPRSGSLFLAVAHNTTPYFTVYNFSSLGFGAKFSNPATLPTNAGYAVSFTNNGRDILVGHATTPYVSAYPWSASGFGTKYTDPAGGAGGTIYNIAVNSVSNTVFFATGNATRYLQAWSFTSGTGWGSRYADPDASPNNSSVVVNRENDLVVIGSTAYKWSSITGWGLKYSAPTTALDGGVYGTEINKSSTVLFFAVNALTTGYLINAYEFTNGVGYGTKLSAPASMSINQGSASTLGGNPIKLTNANDAIAAGHDSATYNYIRVWPWNNSTKTYGTEYSAPATIPQGTVTGVAFSPDDRYIAVSFFASPYIAVYPWNSTSGFGTRFSDPATLPQGNARGISWNIV